MSITALSLDEASEIFETAIRENDLGYRFLRKGQRKVWLYDYGMIIQEAKMGLFYSTTMHYDQYIIDVYYSGMFEGAAAYTIRNRATPNSILTWLSADKAIMLKKIGDAYISIQQERGNNHA